MSQTYDTNLVISIAHDVVEKIAPDELPLFPSISRAYAEEPDRLLKPQVSLDKSLGFGSIELVPVLTLIVLPIIQQALGQIAGNGLQKSSETLFGRMKRAITKRSSLQKQAHISQPREFGREDLILIRSYIIEAARQKKFSETNAQQFADTVIARLATRETETEKI